MYFCNNFISSLNLYLSRLLLQAIEKDRLALISPDIQSSQRPTQQLTYRLDVLQEELNKKSEEASYFQTNFYDLKVSIETKNDENKELRSKVFSLEEKNLNLEQELSSYRILHLNYDNKEIKLNDKKNEKEKGKLKPEEKKVATKSNFISKTKYEEMNKNVVSPES